MDPDQDADSERSPRDDAPFDLEYRQFSLPLREPLGTGDGTIETREGFLVRVTDGETAGLGEATPLPGWTESFADCSAALERAARAVSPADDTSAAATAALDAVDETTAARNAVTLALLDYQAIRADEPLYRLLGDTDWIARVPVNATVGDASATDTATEARTSVDRGFECCKVKVGARDVETDLERVSAVRDAVGPDVELRVDANGAWAFEQAERAVTELADLGVDLLEQPLPPGALGGHAALRDRGVAIALDEGLLEHGIDGIDDADAADAIVLKPMAVGGVDVALELASWGRELGFDPIVTTTIDGVVARTGAVHLAAAIPNVPACGLATADLLAEDLGRDPVPIEKGAAVVPQAKGLGVSGVWEE